MYEMVRTKSIGVAAVPLGEPKDGLLRWIGEVGRVAGTTEAEAVDGSGAAPATILTGLIGMDIQGSRSPAMHEREAEALGIRLEYRLFDLAVAPRTGNDLAATLDEVRRSGFAGVNITHPFKQRLHSWYSRLGYRAIGTEDVAKALPEIEKTVIPCDLVTYERVL